MGQYHHTVYHYTYAPQQNPPTLPNKVTITNMNEPQIIYSAPPQYIENPTTNSSLEKDPNNP